MNQIIEYTDHTLYEVIKKNSKAYQSRTAIDFMDKTMSYPDFLNKIDRVSSSFLKMGIIKGDKIALCLPNCPQAALSIYALNRIGAVAVLLNPLLPATDIFHLLNETDCKGIIILNLILSRFTSIYASCPNLNFVISANIIEEMSLLNALATNILAFSRTVKAIAAQNTLNSIPFRNLYIQTDILSSENIITADDPAIIVFSGGTTGASKAVVYSSRSLNAAVLQSLATEPPTCEDTSMLAVLPYFHIFGLNVTFHMAFAAAGTCIMVPRFNPNNIVKLMIKKKPTYMSAVPTIFEGILKSRLLETAMKKQRLDFQKFRIAFCGGDNLSEKTYQKFNELIRNFGGRGLIVEGYGLTECCPVTVMRRNEYRKGSLGLPFPGISICIVRPDTIEELPADTEGEICVSTPAVMTGYLNSPEETNKVLRIHHDGKLWLHTGDIGTVDNEGYLFFRDRIRRLIKVSGYSVFALTVEKVLQSHPAVLTSCVLGIHDEYSIQKIKAFVVLREHCNENKIRHELIAICKDKLMPWSVPKIIEFRDTLPTNLLGKVSLSSLAEQTYTTIP